jgi:hypothetical protein
LIKDARTTMSSVPDEPEKLPGFSEPFMQQGFSSGRYAVHVIISAFEKPDG